MKDAVNSVQSQVMKVPILPSKQQENTIQIFVSGDKSSVGKAACVLASLEVSFPWDMIDHHLPT
jgi:hypothetical protein